MRFCRQRPKRLRVRHNRRKVRRHFLLDRETVGGGEMRQIRYGGINRLRHGDRARLILQVLVARGGEQQHLPNHGGKALGLIADERTILLHLSA